MVTTTERPPGYRSRASELHSVDTSVGLGSGALELASAPGSKTPVACRESGTAACDRLLARPHDEARLGTEQQADFPGIYSPAGQFPVRTTARPRPTPPHASGLAVFRRVLISLRHQSCNRRRVEDLP